MIEKHLISQEEILAANIASVQTKIARAAERAKRDPAEVTLVAVSKTKPLELIQLAYTLGLRHFGENRVQEAIQKIQTFQPEQISWHMIGHLQSNKANKVVGAFDCIHSLDSIHLAQTLNRYAEIKSQQQQTMLRQPVFLQVNISGETSKEGIAPTEAVQVAREIVALPHLDVQGLMTVAPLVEDVEEVRPVFKALYALRERLRQEVADSTWHHLSMGMTDDYHIAIEEGATIVRVGRAIFGERERAHKGGAK